MPCRMSSAMLVLAACGPALVGSIQLLQLDSDLVPEEVQGTLLGCTCESSCAAREEDNFNCDGCLTNENCSEGGWDYCVYPPNDNFEQQTFREKMDDWWGKITQDDTPANFPDPFGVVTVSVKTSFENLKDEMPAGRVKSVHTRGSICKFELNITEDSPYTGLLGPGKQEGLIRMGGAVDADLFRGLVPGLGFKFARTGVRSGNLMAMHSAALQDLGWNFFANNFSNHISFGGDGPLTDKFRQASQCSNLLGISDLARYSQDGRAHDDAYLNFPFKLFLVPSKDAQQMYLEEETLDGVHQAMAGILEGTQLFSVYACGEPSPAGEMTSPTSVEEACGSPLKLGEVVTTSECTTSKYGDESFQIRHQSIEEDWVLRPDFLSKFDAGAVCGHPNKTLSPDDAPEMCADL